MSDDARKRYAAQLAGFGVAHEGRSMLRQDHCGGALLKKYGPDGSAYDERIECAGIARPREALCSRCAGLEAQNRMELRARLQTKKPISPSRRGFGEGSE